MMYQLFHFPPIINNKIRKIKVSGHVDITLNQESLFYASIGNCYLKQDRNRTQIKPNKV